MNRIYRRIWNATRRCWVVASELSSPRGKPAQTRVLMSALLLTAAGSVSATSIAEEAELEAEQDATTLLVQKERILLMSAPAVSAMTSASFAPQGLTYQAAVVTSGNYADAVVSGQDTLALGSQSRISGTESTALGNYAKTTGGYATALGHDAQAFGGHSTAVGRSSRATVKGATALGQNAQARSENAIAIGSGAYADDTDSVAIGANSLSSGSNTVSVGRSGGERRITNVREGSNGTDAVNVNQLANTNRNVATAYDMASTARSTATSAQTTANTAQNTANTAKSNADSALSKANALSALLSQTASNGNVRIGAGNSGSLLDIRNSGGSSRKITGVAEGTIGSSSTDAVNGTQLNRVQNSATDARTVANSAQTSANTAQTTANAARTNADSALSKANTLSTLLSQTASNGNVRIGAGNSGSLLDIRNSGGSSRKITGVAEGTIGSSSTDAVNGTQLNRVQNSATDARTVANSAQTSANTAQTTANAAKTNADSALSKANTLSSLLSQTASNGNVRIGGGNSGTTLDVRNSGNSSRLITGVAKGKVDSTSSDAVNGQQLFATDEMARGAETLARGAATAADNAVAKVTVLEGLVREDGPAGSVRLGGNNSGSVLDVRNKSDGKRKISGVADGALVAGSADAVTGGQLAATNASLARVEAASRHIAVGTPIDDEKAQAGRLGIAIGDSAYAAPTKDGAVALGSYARAEGEDSVALGRASWVQEAASRGFALGSRSVVEEVGGLALGSSSSVRKGAANAVAIGAGSSVSESETVSFGNGTLKRRLINVAQSTVDDSAATVGQLKGTLATLGGDAKLDAAGNVTAPTYIVQNTRQHTVGDALTTLDGAVLRTSADVDRVQGQLRSVFQDAPALQANGINQVVLAGANGALMTNLADGRIAAGSRDAVNGGQLYAAERRIERNRADLDAMQSEWGSQKKSMQPQSNGSTIDYGGARLTGVADARLATDSSDVVRASQLYQTNLRLKSVEDWSRDIAFGRTLDEWKDPAAAGLAGVAIGRGAVASLQSEGGVAVGVFATAQAHNSVALGRAAYVIETATEGFALGVYTAVEAAGGVALGSGGRVKEGAIDSVALGSDSIATEARTVSIGSSASPRRLTNLASGTASHNAVNVGQLRSALVAIGSEVDANGNIVGPQFNVQGGIHTTVNDALTSLDGAVISTTSRVANVEGQLRSVFQDTPTARADGLNQITLAGANGMILSNVGNGLIAAGSRDAVNGGQLHSMQQQLNGRMDGLEQRIDGQPQPRMLALASDDTGTPASTPVVEEPTSPASKDDKVAASTGSAPKSSPPPKAEAPESPKPQVDTAELEKMLARANDYSDGIAREVDARLNKMDKRFNRMAAMSSAQTAMAMNTAGLATYNRLGAGVGYAEGESAMAVGYQRVLNDKGSATFSLNGAFTNSGERSMGVGVGIGW